MKTKRYLKFLIVLVFLLLAYRLLLIIVHAQTPTPTATKSATPTTAIDEKVSELKERIATQVAKLNIIKKRGIVGTISDSSNNQLILEDTRGNKRFVDVDELTKFTDQGEKRIGISDLKKGDQVSIIGLYNTESRRLLARFIKTLVPRQRIWGEVTQIDRENFALEVLDAASKETKIVDVESTTKTQIYQKTGLTKGGFSKIEIGEKILVVGFPKKQERMTASRILLFPELSPNLKPSPTASPTPTPTKTQVTPTLTPKKSPTVTPKRSPTPTP